jgi:hypothetical protein
MTGCTGVLEGRFESQIRGTEEGKAGEPRSHTHAHLFAAPTFISLGRTASEHAGELVCWFCVQSSQSSSGLHPGSISVHLTGHSPQELTNSPGHQLPPPGSLLELLPWMDHCAGPSHMAPSLFSRPHVSPFSAQSCQGH